MSTADKQTGKLSLRMLVYSLLALVVGFVSSQKWLSEKENRQVVSNFFSDSRLMLCEQGVRLPGDDCKSIKINRDPDDKRTLNELVTSAPDMTSALFYFQWGNGTEADAAKYLALMRSMYSGRTHQYGTTYKALDPYVSMVHPIWQKYPKLVAGAACTFCADQHKAVDLLLKTPPFIETSLSAEMALDVTFMSSMLSHKSFPASAITNLLPLHAYLSSAGDSQTARAIADALIKGKKWSELKLWVDSGLNGGQALSNHSLESLPREIVVTAWQQGVSLGYDNIDLTEYLVSTGHRPALRWLLWTESTDFRYLHDYSYNRKQVRYKQMLKKHTAFSQFSGLALAEFYNKNWRDINWKQKEHRWGN